MFRYEMTLVIGFIATVFAIPISQIAYELYLGNRPEVLTLLSQSPTEGNLRQFETDMESASWATQVSQSIMAQTRFQLSGDLGAKVVVGREDWLFYKPGVDYLINREPVRELENTGLEAAAETIIEFRDQLAARGIRLLVVPVPGKASVYPEMLSQPGIAITAGFDSRTKRLLMRLSESKVETVDLFSAFHQSRLDTKLQHALYLKHDTHWSGMGVQIAAAAIVNRIDQLGWIEVESDSFELHAITVERIGDIPLMTQLQRITRTYPAESTVCYQVIDKRTRLPIENDEDSPILLLGDSFARIYETDAPRSAGLSAHLSYRLGRSIDSIINDGGASTLVRQKLARKPKSLRGKKIVIWEFAERDIRYGTEGWQRVDLPKL